MIYYTTATSRNRKRQLKFLVFCSGNELLFDKKSSSQTSSNKNIHVRHFMKNLGALGWADVVLIPQRWIELGRFFPQRNFGNRRSGGRFTHILK